MADLELAVRYFVGGSLMTGALFFLAGVLFSRLGSQDR